MGMLGVTSCDRILPRVEYGMPHADHTLKGSVTTLQNVALPGIRVVVKVKDKEWADTLKTDASGNYMFQDPYAWPDTDYDVIFEDTDGAENGGTFRTQTQTAEFGNYSKPSGNWYHGAQTVTLNVKMENE